MLNESGAQPKPHGSEQAAVNAEQDWKSTASLRYTLKTSKRQPLKKPQLVLVAQTCNPTYSRSWGRRITTSRLAWAKEQDLGLSGQIGKNETISKICKDQGCTGMHKDQGCICSLRHWRSPASLLTPPSSLILEELAWTDSGLYSICKVVSVWKQVWSVKMASSLFICKCIYTADIYRLIGI